MSRSLSVYVGPAWPDGTPEPGACCTFRCADSDCAAHYEDTPCTRKYRVPGGYVCELCAEAYDTTHPEETG